MNTRSLIANGQEFKKFVYDMDVAPDVVCVQETWLKPQLKFVNLGFSLVRCDRIGGVRWGLFYICLRGGGIQCIGDRNM